MATSLFGRQPRFAAIVNDFLIPNRRRGCARIHATPRMFLIKIVVKKQG
jgi:hypothetical protein